MVHRPISQANTIQLLQMLNSQETKERILTMWQCHRLAIMKVQTNQVFLVQKMAVKTTQSLAVGMVHKICGMQIQQV